MPGEAALERRHLLAHGPGVADDAPCPFQHLLALRREALETRAARDQQHAKLALQLLDAGGERGLRHPADLRRTPEMVLAGESDQELELVDHASAFSPRIEYGNFG